MTVVTLAEPGVGVGGRESKAVQAVDFVAVGDPRVAIIIGPGVAFALARVTRFAIT